MKSSGIPAKAFGSCGDVGPKRLVSVAHPRTFPHHVILLWTPWTQGVESRRTRCPLGVTFLNEIAEMKYQDESAFRANSSQLVASRNFISNFALKLKDALRNATGWYLETSKAPARLEVFEFVDPQSDETIYLYTSQRYSVLCVGTTRLYFDRVTGKFDGVSSPAQLSVAGGLKLSD